MSVSFQNSPDDSISSLAVNGSADTDTTVLIAGSWDNTVSCYTINYNQSAFTPQPTIAPSAVSTKLKHDAPVLAVDLDKQDGITSYSAGCDGKVRMWNVTQPASSAQVIGQHQNAIRCVQRARVGQSDVVVTGSWDKTIRCWDPRAPAGSNPSATTALSERVYAMDIKDTAMVVATADRMVHIFDLRNGLSKISEYQSPVRFQPMCVSVFSDLMGFALGAVDGRIAIEHFSEVSRKNHDGTYKSGGTGPNFTYKCHREPRGSNKDDGCDAFAINDLTFHPNNTFASSGSDGQVLFWDKDARVKLGGLLDMKGRCPITCSRYSPNGKILFYAASYDWSKGAMPEAGATMGNNIYGVYLTEGQKQKKR